jgi:hypothetical protein
MNAESWDIVVEVVMVLIPSPAFNPDATVAAYWAGLL